MYLKSIEMHGFKSFANKIVLEFHNGITGIVGPNGSGKSNVADAVRWVLGEQSAKQLRGASMQDVIFAGTENRKALSYAYVAITMDNSDHVLPIDYEEVTVARRVYRSGESEYILNGTTCRLRDVHELFYDTGIGKEGYSIIGQGQIERILSGKPEDRRELFDEAVGIVKYKKRKATAQKKLADEQDNLVRINDILNELEDRIGPLEEQAKTAREYLELKSRQKKLDVNLFLIDMEELNAEAKRLSDAALAAQEQLDEAERKNERIKNEYAILEEKIKGLDERIEQLRTEEKNTTLTKGKLENEIALLEEMIRSDGAAQKSYDGRYAEIEAEIAESKSEEEKYENNINELQELLKEATTSLSKAKDYYQGIQDTIDDCNSRIEANQKRLRRLLEERSKVLAEEERLKTLNEQLAIRRAGLNKRLLARKTESDTLAAEVDRSERELEEKQAALLKKREEQQSINHKIGETKSKQEKLEDDLSHRNRALIQAQSQLESIRSIAERYEGYGTAIKKVMEEKHSEPKLVGVVADLINVKKEYETAIETALGGNIQNIVTEDEGCAKRMISMLKKNRYGRATFLPMTSVKGNNNIKNPTILEEEGVVGRACELLEYDSRYKGIMNYLLGRIIVARDIDSALSLSRKNNHSLNIVTLEGEYLRPGGSLSGGAYRRSGNLLARNRRIEELEDEIEKEKKAIGDLKERIERISTARALLEDDLSENTVALHEASLVENTVKINLEAAREAYEKNRLLDDTLADEGRQIENELKDISEQKDRCENELKEITEEEKQLDLQNEKLQKTVDEQTYMENTAARNVSEIEMEEISAREKVTFVEENLSRIREELKKRQRSREEILSALENARLDAEEKKQNIERIRDTIGNADANYKKLQEDLRNATEEKNRMDEEYKGFFDRKEEISGVIGNLEKELLRLESAREKNEDTLTSRSDYMWSEYELTLHAAMDMKDDELADGPAMKKELSLIRDDIRSMGNVNVNAIEEYQTTRERYDTLKTQHDDIVDAAEKLSDIIAELDEGMRKQFREGFADIQREFDRAFKELFGGGKGTLELLPDEDILETGIRIIAQPPGKKLQNMMQLSGGEKSLTAISLLFAIQNLKPSPFCLLDEIEAALDDSNVTRFAGYLHKLTKNTQFIVITHRRGTMNASDRLYGITMQEKGISTLVSVNLIEDDLDE